MSEKKKTDKEKAEGKGHGTKKGNLDDTYIGPTEPLEDKDPRQRGPRRRG